MNYPCPVCGYTKLISPPKDYTICPSCGTEFGYDDFATTYDELRNAWLAAGAPWFSQHTPPPANWNPIAQLLAAGYGYSLSAGEANQKVLTVTVGEQALHPKQSLAIQLGELVKSVAAPTIHTYRITLAR